MLTNIKYNPNYYSNAMSKLIAIAPAPERKSLVLPVKKYDCKGSGCNPSASIARRNARERSRVKQVNDGFNELRKRLPSTVITALCGNTRRGYGKKLSKVDTLRMVVEYIKYLQRVVEESDEALGITSVSRAPNVTSCNIDDVFGRNSLYPELALSPVSSEYSSGASSVYSHTDDRIHGQFEKMQHVENDDILNSIYW